MRLRESEAMQPMTRRRFIGTMGLAAAAPLGLTSNAIAVQTPGSARGSVSVEKNIVFGRGGNTDLHLDIYRPPAGTEKRMATIHIHGGGFTGGSKDTLTERVPPMPRADTWRSPCSTVLPARPSGHRK